MTVKIILMRHGQAEDVAASDSDRQLTEFGQNEVMMAAERLKDLDARIDRLLTSPYLRAQQTAAIVSDVTGCPAAQVSSAFVPGGEPDKAIEVLSRECEDVDCAMVVMHQPIISRMIQLMSGEQQPMSTAAIAVLEAPVVAVGCFELICVI